MRISDWSSDVCFSDLFAHWRIRLALLWGGRMPVTRLLPVAWYETPNIHHVTVSDFRDLVRAKGINVERVWHLSGQTGERRRRQLARRACDLPDFALDQSRLFSPFASKSFAIRAISEMSLSVSHSP